MPTQVYLRNPFYYFDTVADLDHRFLSFDYGLIKRRSLKFLELTRDRLGASRPFEVLVVALEGTAMYNETSTSVGRPAAVYPTWANDHGWKALIDLCKRPVHEDPALVSDLEIPSHFRPVPGQAHRIVIYKTPAMKTAAAANWMKQLMTIQLNFPHVDFIVHDSRSFRTMFIMEFFGVTWYPMIDAWHNAITLPNGMKVNVNEFPDDKRKRMWINTLGYRVDEFDDLQMRVMFNCQSAIWASNFFRSSAVMQRAAELDDLDLLDLADDHPDIIALRMEAINKRALVRTSLPGDGIMCDHCSIKFRCGYAREGAVCGLPSKEYGKLAELFGSRDANAVIDGLAKLGEIQAKRVMEDLDAEAVSGERTADTDRRIKMLADHGVKTAKLIDPKLNGAGVQVNVGAIGGTVMVGSTPPAQLLAGMVAELEARGVPREQITPDAIVGLLEATSSREGREKLDDVIDAEVIPDDDE